MRKRPERVAWTVLGVAFAIACVLAVGIPLTLRSYLLDSMEDQETVMQVIEGTVLVQKADGGDPRGVTESAVLLPGDEAITDDRSWATLDLFERSHVTLYRDARVMIGKAQSPRFGVSANPNEITLDVTGGIVRVGVALPVERSTDFRVETPHGLVYLDEGSYRIEVANDGTQLTVVRGRARVSQEGSKLVIQQGQRTQIGLTGEATSPLPAAQNLVENGSFQEPLQTGWLTDTVVLDESVAAPTVSIVENGGRRAVRLARREQDDGIHTEVAIRQPLDHDVRDFVRLQISADIKLDFQSLSGGGQLSSEFPIIIRLDYKDRWGSDKFWTHGFYYQNTDGYPIAPDPWGQPSGEEIPSGVWFPYESGNLLELLGESGPAYLTGITIYASGWNYESLVSEIQLTVE